MWKKKYKNSQETAYKEGQWRRDGWGLDLKMNTSANSKFSMTKIM